MTRETIEWLSNNILVGFTDDRGEAWWKMHDATPTENHFAGEVPQRRAEDLLGFETFRSPIYIEDPKRSSVKISDPDRVAITRYDSDGNVVILGVHGADYQEHGFREWLIDHVFKIVGQELKIGSVGLLERGAVAFAQMEMPTTVKMAEGEAYRPFIAATSSLNGRFATDYKLGITRIVCDNTRDAYFATGEKSFKVKHTKHSLGRVQDAQQALGLVESLGKAYETEVKRLIEMKVTPNQWQSFLDLYNPIPQDEGRGKTRAENRQITLMDLYRTDDRVAPWANTAWGVLQAVSTYEQHLATIRKVAPRQERNITNFLEGKTETRDREAMKMLEAVLAAA